MLLSLLLLLSNLEVNLFSFSIVCAIFSLRSNSLSSWSPACRLVVMAFILSISSSVVPTEFLQPSSALWLVTQWLVR